jgi:hypothetical protein
MSSVMLAHLSELQIFLYLAIQLVCEAADEKKRTTDERKKKHIYA